MYKRQIHIDRLRRFAGSKLNVTEELRISIEQDHPDNIVAKIVDHQVVGDVLWMTCRWRGFTAELDSAQRASILAEDCPDVVRDYYKHRGTRRDRALEQFMHDTFPSMEHEDSVARQRQQPDAVAPGKRPTLRRRGRPIARAAAVTTCLLYTSPSPRD